MLLSRDIASMYKEPPPGLHISADENDITKVWFLKQDIKLSLSIRCPITPLMPSL